MYISSLKFLLQFKTTSLYESVSQSNMEVMGTNSTVTLLSGGQGYAMQTDQYLLGDGPISSGFAFDITTDFTIGFWLYPTNLGMVSNPSTGVAESITLPVMDFVSGDSIIRFTEHTTSNEKNYIQIDINDTAYSAVTPEYSAAYWHHFWVCYDGSSLSVYIDGMICSLTETGSLPASIGGSMANLYVNHSLEGYAYNIAKNNAYIGDIYVFNVSTFTEEDIQRAINLGINYIADDTYTNREWASNSIYFNDPSMITINSAIDDMSFIYMGRSDGKILRGSPKFWEVRKIYSNSVEANLINLPSEATTGQTPNPDNVSDGFLKLKSQVIRL